MPDFDVLFSLRPAYARAISAGVKTVELRRLTPNIPVRTRIWIYSTQPEAKIIAVGHIEKIDTGTTTQIWKKYGEASFISKINFDQYFKDAKNANAIVLRDIVPIDGGPSLAKMKDSSPSFVAPQFYRRIWRDTAEFDVLNNSTPSVKRP